jgi:UDP-glucose 4-epimerase
VIPTFINRALRGEDLHINGSGAQTRDFIYVGDVVRAIDFIAQHRRLMGHTLYNVGYGESIDIKSLAELIIELTGSDSKIVYDKSVTGDISRSCANNFRLQNLGFKLHGNGFENGLKKTIEYYKELK